MATKKSKHAIKSRTVQGGLVQSVSAILLVFGIQNPEMAGDIAIALGLIGELVGLAMTYFGRKNATDTIHLIKGVTK